MVDCGGSYSYLFQDCQFGFQIRKMDNILHISDLDKIL